MTIVLLAVGLMVAAAGFVTIGFGIPINAFSLGNTLIIAGTIAATSGFILIALAVLIGQLRRIAEALKTRPVRVTRSDVVPVAVIPAVEAAVARPGAPSKPEPAPVPVPQEPVAAEPRFPATAGDIPEPLDWLRAKSRSTSAAPLPVAAAPGDAPVVEIPDEAPLSPRPPQRPAVPQARAVEPVLEPRVWSPSRPGGPLEPRVAPRVEQPAVRAEPQKERERFDLMWPDNNSAPAQAPQVEPAPHVPTEPVRREPALEMPMPPIPARSRDARGGARVDTATKPTAERGPAILKSGVIDGMPYTLYVDGSIEADLPTGTVKFASVDALRAHLEKQG